MHWKHSDQENLVAAHSFPHLSEQSKNVVLIFPNPKISQGE